MVTAANVSDGVVQYDECRRTTEEAFKNRLTNKSRPEIGDILITKDGTLGRMAIVDRVPLCINQSVAVLRPKKTVDNRYLKLLLESPLYQKRILDDAGGSTIKHIYISKIDKMVIGVPKKMSEQIAIRERLESHLKQLYQTEILSRKLRSVRTALMQDLLTGKKRVTTLLASEPKREKMYG
jgi:type I restriction enzyme S subunit